MWTEAKLQPGCRLVLSSKSRNTHGKMETVCLKYEEIIIIKQAKNEKDTSLIIIILKNYLKPQRTIILMTWRYTDCPFNPSAGESLQNFSQSTDMENILVFNYSSKCTNGSPFCILRLGKVGDQYSLFSTPRF